MIRCATTLSCRNNSINTRKLVSRNPIRQFIVASLLVALFPLSASAIDIETPAVGLTGVPLDYTVSGVAEGTSVRLEAAGKTYIATADAEGNAAFSDVVIAAAGETTVSAMAGGVSASKDLRVIPGWVSVLPATWEHQSIGACILSGRHMSPRCSSVPST